MILRGVIRDRDPIVRAFLGGGTLHLATRGPLSVVVDTGFSGSVSLPRSLLRRMRMKREGFQEFRLADGRIVRLPVYSGHLAVGRRRVRAWFIPGEALLGIEIPSVLASELTLDFRKGTVSLR